MPSPVKRDASADPVSFPPLIACEYCDAVHQQTDLAEGERALCLRCGGLLYRESQRAYHRQLPLVVTALILFMLASACPIVELDLKGVRTATSLWGAIQALSSGEMVPVAILVFATTILFPLTEMLMLLYLLVPMAQHRMPPGFGRLVRGIQRARPWGMLEVFMIGVLVTLVKLSTIAQVQPGVALWSFAALMIVLAVMLSFDPRNLWRHLRAQTPR
ncbi:paraquat-inducible protein A [Cupriavidus basilensis]|uniref:paraquat-inducible protein A n=1 Tax=Cupriavidus basilensis TaxID=68895 RepID=UPI0006828868|nr:paraquat-inducible protein A [Cupriavidus basilensis]